MRAWSMAGVRLFVQHEHTVRGQIVGPRKRVARQEIVHGLVELHPDRRGFVVE